MTKLAVALIAIALLSQVAFGKIRARANKTTVIDTDDAPKAIGPYTQGRTIIASRLVFTAGQIGMDPKTMNLVSDDVVEQATQALKNLEAVLIKGNSSMSQVIKATVFLTDMNDFAKVNDVYANVFGQPFPARSCVAVSSLPKGAKFEIEVVAYTDEEEVPAPTRRGGLLDI